MNSQSRPQASPPASSVSDRPLRVVSVTTMFPNSAQPIFGVFVKKRLDALAERVDLKVLAPTPHFPWVAELIPQYRERRQIPTRGQREPYPVSYPRFLSVPRILKPMDGHFLARTLRRELQKIKNSGFHFDLIDAHLAFPDGYAAVRAAEAFGVPTTVTLRGHDINELPDYPGRGRQVRWTLKNADRIFSVAKALSDRAVELGAKPDNTRVTRNGVDTDRFFPGDKIQARQALGLEINQDIILSVGYLVPRKGFGDLIAALPYLRGRSKPTRLVIIGGRGGEEYTLPALKEQIKTLGLEEQVVFTGPLESKDLGNWFRAADVFALLSRKEGCPNVVLEALASGRPVVATRAWGIPEVVRDGENGFLIDVPPEATVTAKALEGALDHKWTAETIAKTVSHQTWPAVAQQLETEMRTLLETRVVK